MKYILDKFDCVKCGKEVILDGEEKYIGCVDRGTVDGMCKDCYNQEFEEWEYRQYLQDEYYRCMNR